jgi:tight adherence protein B
MGSMLILAAVFVCVTALVGGGVMLLRTNSETTVEDRLAMLTGTSNGKQAKDARLAKSVLARPLDNGGNHLESFFARFKNFTLLFEQADTTLTLSQFLAVSGGLGLIGMLVPVVLQLHAAWAPGLAAGLALLPLAWLWFRRARRLKAFGKQLPDALELMSRALRAGHSLSSGFNLVAEEMMPPMSTEFGRVFEEQNLGIPLDEALNNLTDRIPNLDLRFFATAVILQRQTGGDLAEILDKIGYLVRERFKIWGQVQALTGEGRISGVVLLGLPPALFVAVWRLNPDYVMPLFTDPLGKKMLVVGLIMQTIGALVIRKIVNIKV